MLVYTLYVHCIVINVNTVTRVIIRIASANYCIGHTTPAGNMHVLCNAIVGGGIRIRANHSNILNMYDTVHVLTIDFKLLIIRFFFNSLTYIL